ncbi:MAG: Uma2 family endonuclease [Candidatus Solibacter usitatus]|nr:Uma2 family endonuclease [Candidatus Solibacter usitatus]
MATSIAVPVEEYLRTSYDPDMEYVDGQLLERHVGEHFHSLLQILLGAELNSRRRSRRFRVFAEQRIQISAEPRYRIPDLCVMALPYEVAPVLRGPHLVIEILSPDDTGADTLTKITDYLRADIPHVWIIDPYERTLTEAGQSGVRRPAGLVLATPLVGEVDFAPLFAELDEPTE